MKNLIITGLFILLGISAAHADITIIANQNVDMRPSDIPRVFKGEITRVGKVDIVLVDNKAARDQFCNKVLVIYPEKYTSMWAKKTFREGVQPPKMKNTDNEVIDFVKSTPGALGYIGGTAPNGVNVVKKY